jgi:hypothetical protein
MQDVRRRPDVREQQKARLIKANCGEWESVFVRIGSSRAELERFPCHLSVLEKRGLIEAQLTYLRSGKIARSAFRDIPDSMQIQAAGHWSLGPQCLTQEFWTTEFCLCGPHERRRAVVRQRRDWLESLVVIVEWRAGYAYPPLLPGSAGSLYLEETRGDATSTFAVMGEGLPLGLQLTISNTPEEQSTSWRWDSASITRRYGSDRQLMRESVMTTPS